MVKEHVRSGAKELGCLTLSRR